MTPEEIKKAVEEYPYLLTKREKLHNRLIRLSGRDPEQEAAVMQRFEEIDNVIELIDMALYENTNLTDRELCIVDHRIDGLSPEKIGPHFLLTGQRIRTILETAYTKMANAINKQDLT